MTNRKKTILIVDDSHFMRSLIKSIVIKNGFRVIGEADNGIMGAEKFKKLRPDIVTLDINMDEATGLAALELIMSHDPNAHVIMISSIMGQSVYADEAKSKGAKAVLTKPVEEKALVDALLGIKSK